MKGSSYSERLAARWQECNGCRLHAGCTLPDMKTRLNNRVADNTSQSAEQQASPFNRISFNINVDDAGSTGLNISSKLLLLAISVTGGD